MIPSFFSSFTLFYFSPQVSTNVQIPTSSTQTNRNKCDLAEIAPELSAVCSPPLPALSSLQPCFAELVPPHLPLAPDVT